MVGLLLAFAPTGCGDDAPPIVGEWKLELRGEVGYPIEVGSAGCTQTIGERMRIEDESNGFHVYYWVFDDCEDPVDEGREEAEALFTMDKGEDGTYDLLFVDIFVPGTYTGTCTVEGDELHCNIPPNTHDIYIRAD
jgi:hypothetical protein